MAHLVVVMIITIVQEVIEAIVIEVEGQGGFQEEVEEFIYLKMVFLVQATLVLFTQVQVVIEVETLISMEVVVTMEGFQI